MNSFSVPDHLIEKFHQLVRRETRRAVLFEDYLHEPSPKTALRLRERLAKNLPILRAMSRSGKLNEPQRREKAELASLYEDLLRLIPESPTS